MAKRRVVRRKAPAPVEEGWVVGIDPSLTKAGVVAYNGVEHRTWLLKPKGTGVRRLRWIMEEVQGIFFDLGLDDVDAVALEGYAFSRAAKSQAHKIGEGGAAFKLACFDTFGPKHEAGFPYIVTASTLKKFITGSGKGEKDKIMLAAFKKWDVELEDNNVTDAYGLARWMWAFKYGTEIKYEQECLTKFEREV